MTVLSQTITGNPQADHSTDAWILSAKIDRFAAMIAGKDRNLIEELWSQSGFCLVGSERGEIYRTRAEVEAKLEAIFANPKTLNLDLPSRRIDIVGDVGWIFADGVLRRCDAVGGEDARQYLAICIFQKAEGSWRWRQFFGSEPY